MRTPEVPKTICSMMGNTEAVVEAMTGEDEYAQCDGVY